VPRPPLLTLPSCSPSPSSSPSSSSLSPPPPPSRPSPSVLSQPPGISPSITPYIPSSDATALPQLLHLLDLLVSQILHPSRPVLILVHPAWSAGFPQGTPDSTQLPPQWLSAYNAAMAAGKIPKIPPTTQTGTGTNPVYPQGIDPTSPDVCSATSYGCRNPADIWDGPNGYILTSFDDGPLPPTTTLRQFMDQNHETTTHFFIGQNILYNPPIFQSVFEAGDDIAIHTWTHPYMTTLSNLDVVAQVRLWISSSALYLLIRSTARMDVPIDIQLHRWPCAKILETAIWGFG